MSFFIAITIFTGSTSLHHQRACYWGSQCRWKPRVFKLYPVTVVSFDQSSKITVCRWNVLTLAVSVLWRCQIVAWCGTLISWRPWSWRTWCSTVCRLSIQQWRGKKAAARMLGRISLYVASKFQLNYGTQWIFCLILISCIATAVFDVITYTY